MCHVRNYPQEAQPEDWVFLVSMYNRALSNLEWLGSSGNDLIREVSTGKCIFSMGTASFLAFWFLQACP